MTRDGQTRTLFDRIDGQPIGKVNFVLRDAKQRIWLTVSTRVNPWTTAAARRVRDGYIAVVDEHGIRVVADGFHFTNEIRLDAKEEWLYIVETTGPHISRMRLDESHPDGVRLTDREVESLTAFMYALSQADPHAFLPPERVPSGLTLKTY